jgi:hypothetical protein
MPMPGEKKPPPVPDYKKMHASIVENQTEEAFHHEGGIKAYFEKMNGRI